MRKEAALAWFNVLLRNLYGGTEGNHDTSVIMGGVPVEILTEHPPEYKSEVLQL
jgi:hypothetical protein